MIECKCGCGTQIEELDKYGRKREYKNGHNNRKYEDPIQYKREWNHRNRKSRLEYKKLYGQKRKGKLLLILGGKCDVCELSYDGTNACVFDFHHTKEKKFLLGQTQLVNRKWSDILLEAKKCIILCANCHRVEHSGRY